MTTYVDFVPSPVAAFQFQATFDAGQYNVVVTWNEFGQRYYINVYDLASNLILARSIASSGAQLSATFSWSSNYATAVTSGNHNVPVGQMAAIQVSGTGLGYDGSYQALASSRTTLMFVLAENPGSPGSGNVGQDINLLAGYFSSSLVFRGATQQFEF
jgi:hypothetical protein